MSKTSMWGVPLFMAFFASIVAHIAWSSPLRLTSRLPGQGSVSCEVTSLEDPTTWLPQGKILAQNERGDDHDFNVKWTSVAGTANRKLVVHILRISKYPGVCGNAPLLNPTLDPDFKMEGALNGAWTLGTPKATGDTFEQWAVTTNVVAVDTPVGLKVSSFDFAAKLSIRCFVDKEVTNDRTTDFLDTFNPNQPNIDSPDLHSSETKGYPVDSDADELPDAFEARFPAAATQGAGTDDDTQPTVQADAGPAVPGGSRTTRGLLGDGLTTWEEYRGFSIKEAHVRTDPGKKDLFARSEIEANGPKTIGRLGDAQSLNVTLHEIYATEFTDPPQRMINSNNNGSGNGPVFFNSSPQRGLRAVNGKLPAKTLGMALGGGGKDDKRKLAYINAGINGVRNSALLGDDQELLPNGQGIPNDPYIIAQTAGTPLVSQQAGDDGLIVLPDGRNAITTGPNGSRDSGFLGQTDILTPPPIVIGPGEDGELQSTRGADDEITEVDFKGDLDNAISLTPNEIYLIIVDVASIVKQPQRNAAELGQYVDTIIGHEMGHGVHIAHWQLSTESQGLAGTDKLLNDIYAKSQNDQPTVMTMGLRAPGAPVPHNYSQDELAQIRLHLKR